MARNGGAAKPLHIYPRIPPSGPERAEVLAVGEAPGPEENERGKPFCGKSGKLLNEMLRLEGLKRSEIRVTNLYPRWTGPGNPDPTEAQIEDEIKVVREEVDRCRPRVILLVGRIAARWFMRDPKLEIEAVHGQPFRPTRGDWKRLGLKGKLATLFPIYHPAAALRNPLMAARFGEDVRRFALYLKGDLRQDWVDGLDREIPTRLVDTAGARRLYFNGPVAIDTEGTIEQPWGMSLYDGGAEAYVVLAADAKHVRFGPNAVAIYHYALHDLSVVQAMGVAPPQRFRDGIVSSSLLRFDPQGLKPLSYRLMRRRMRDYDDVVRPYFNEKVVTYLKRVAEAEWPTPKAEIVIDSKTGKEKLYKPWSLNRLAKGALKSFEKDSTIELEKRWKGETRVKAEEGVGPFPGYSIAIELVPQAEAVKYSGEDAISTFLLDPILSERVAKRRMDHVLRQSLDFIPICQRMQEVGLPVDLGRLFSLRDDFEAAMAKHAGRINAIAGEWINPGSDDQVANWLFGVSKVDGGWAVDPRKARVKPRAPTPGGRPSTKDQVLSVLVHKPDTPAYVREFIRGVLDYREVEKCKGTYVDPVIEKVPHYHPWCGLCKRLHVNLSTTQVFTGRLSAYDPNVLSFPTRTELGRRVRWYFKAPRGRAFLSCDLSQIEMRVAAELSGDEKMCAIFREGRDIYTETALSIFGKKEMRQESKTLSLAIMYLMQEDSLHERYLAQGVSRFSKSDCGEQIRDWFKLYRGIKAFSDAQAETAREVGFVRSVSGRIGYYPLCRLEDPELFYVRAEAERQAGNYPIQAGAQDYTQQAGIRLWKWIRGLPPGEVEPLLQIHDEYLLEVPEAKAEEHGVKVKEIMEEGGKSWRRVPVVANWAVAKDWGGLKG